MYDFSTITEVSLASGVHSRPEDGMCFMELVSWFAGEKHSDKPACACPVLGRYGIGLNDSMPADLRDQLLKPLVPMIAGTRDKKSEQKRAVFLAMWAVNRIAPIALRADGLINHAEACENAGTLEEARRAANAADDAASVWTTAVEGLRQAILIGRHDGFTVSDDALATRHVRLAELTA